MQPFNQISYQRPDIKALKRDFNRDIASFQRVKSAQEAKKAWLALQDREDEASTIYSIARIRNTLDTTDPFYEEEIAFFNETLPGLTLLLKKAMKALLKSPFRTELEQAFGSQLFRIAEMEQKTQSSRITPNKIREAKLSSEYQKLVAGCKADFRGEICNFYGLLKHMESPDREERKEAFTTWAGLYEQIEDRLDNLYDQLVETRVSMAKKLGFASYTDLAYIDRHRSDYTAEDVAVFREQVVEVIVPLCVQLRKQQAARLGIEKVRYYDEMLWFPAGNPEPAGSAEDKVAVARDMYHELSTETGEFFDFLTEYKLYDLQTRPGKHLGGYCSSLPAYKAPYIFANFNDSSADIDVLTHEAGHAFAYYTASRNQELTTYCFSTSEINEIHSMGMELFTYPWMEWFFKEQAEEYRCSHLCNALMMIPYITCVDAFQHRVYEKPNMTANERRSVWRELEQTYLPWRDYDGVKNMEAGSFWMQKQHIFLFPFYYIEYALAQICAFDLYRKMEKDRDSAWSDYLSLCRAGGSQSYFELLDLAGIPNPFERGTLKNAVQYVFDVIQSAPWSREVFESGDQDEINEEASHE